MRTETDFIGSVDIPDDALYGIHSVRAKENFPDDTLFHKEWFQAVGVVKMACYRVAKNYFAAVQERFDEDKIPVKRIPENILDAMEMEAAAISRGENFQHFVVPAVSGGAGTSINLNIDEIIANGALMRMGENAGTYQQVDPIEHANVFQSTNDVIPTALKVAAMQLFGRLGEQINDARSEMERLEGRYRDSLRLAYTQMQEAVPSSYGKLFSAWSDALSRDWWRISKCNERIKVVNLGGSAIGTGITVPRFFIMEVIPELQRLTGLPVTRGENLVDATQNLDTLVEVHGILKAHAVNLEKIASDLRLLASGVVGRKEVELPDKQVGSSIMPGKVNPVISEFVISSAHQVYSNDTIITNLSGQGALDLNAYIPVIGHALLRSLKLLVAANETLRKNMLQGLVVNESVSEDQLLRSPSVTTALIPLVGYKKAAQLAKWMQRKNMTIQEANKELNLVEQERLETFLKPQNLLKLGYSVKDLL